MNDEAPKLTTRSMPEHPTNVGHVEEKGEQKVEGWKKPL
jgi:hypothetical protein